MTDSWVNQYDRFTNGMELIKRYIDGEPSMDCLHHTFYFCDYNSTASQMTAEELYMMENWGWYEEEESWAFGF